MMRRLVAGLVLMVVLVACGGGDAGDSASEGAAAPTDTPTLVPAGGAEEVAGGGGAAASCAAIIEFDGRQYFGYAVKEPAQTGASLGNGEIPPCNDTGSSEAATGEAVEEVEIKDVNPERAVVITSNENMIWVISGGEVPNALRDLVQ